MRVLRQDLVGLKRRLRGLSSDMQEGRHFSQIGLEHLELVSYFTRLILLLILSIAALGLHLHRESFAFVLDPRAYFDLPQIAIL